MPSSDNALPQKPTKLKVVVALCTSRRPKMLQDCLASLIRQQLPSDVSLCIAVVENLETDACRAIVESFAAKPGAPRIIYAHEPRLGIPLARNSSLDLALRECADWIAFIDDDEVAEPNWIASLVAASRAFPSVDVWQGVIERKCLSAKRPDWLNRSRNRGPTGTPLKVAATNNSMIRGDLVRSGLRFDETLRFTGGSDRELFLRAREIGAKICYVREAVVCETWPAERCTLAWRLRTDYRMGAVRMQIDQRRSFYSIMGRTALSLGGILLGCIELCAAVPFLVLSRKDCNRRLNRALRRIAHTAGAMSVLLKLRPTPHRTVEGC